MEFLTKERTLQWEETKKLSDHIRRHGVRQFINQYHKQRDRKDMLLWGDEIEYAFIKFDDDNKVGRLRLDAHRVLKALQAQEISGDTAGTWREEYGAFMIESSPLKPYGGSFGDLNKVKENMKLRRKELQKNLERDVIPFTLVNFPRTGCDIFTEPPAHPTPTSGIFQSEFCPDEFIYQQDERIIALTKNIRERRDKKVDIQVPVYKDTKTRTPFIDGVVGKLDHIYMDAVGFGFGCSCLQVTIQAADIDEAKHLYDQLVPLCPLMLALTAGSPIYKGYLADIDNRWSVIAQSADDRTEEEQGNKPLRNKRFIIPKSRYGSVDSYLSDENQSYNDIDLVLDQELCDQLTTSGVDLPLSRHIAHLFIRDSVAIFPEKLNQNDEEETDHFENIQSTNWQSLRFKLPPPKCDIGWRIEFRAMDVQLSDFENAAFAVFIVLLTRVILTYNLNLVIPISKVEENMKTSYERDAVLDGKFYFKKDFCTCTIPYETQSQEHRPISKDPYVNSGICNCHEDEYTLLSMNEIFNGTEEYQGLIPIVNKYIESIEGDEDTVRTVSSYLNFISQKASGKMRTTSRWILDFVKNHPDYKHDSVVSDIINYDLLKLCAKYSKGTTPDFLYRT